MQTKQEGERSSARSGASSRLGPYSNPLRTRAASSSSPVGSRRHELDQIRARRVIFDMRHGSTLHLSLGGAKPRWFLTNGELIPDGIARIVITDPAIAAADDGLFDDCPQTYRHRYGGNPHD
jgi:hypothetical protein